MNNCFVIRIIAFCALICLIQACSSNTFNIKTSKPSLSEEESYLRLPHVKITNVVDRRLNRDTAIGYFKNKDNLIAINLDQPLTTYLSESFNSYISDDKYKQITTPVTLYINDFNVNVEPNSRDYNITHKYSYTFEYTRDSAKKSIEIKDSSKLSSRQYKNYTVNMINHGISTSSVAFIYNFQNKTNAIGTNHDSNSIVVNSASIDKERMKRNIIENKNSGLKSKGGFNFCYYTGQKIFSGIRVEYISLMSKDTINSEVGMGFGFSYLAINRTEKYYDIKYLSLNSRLLYRYNFSNQKDGFFVGGNFNFAGGIEKFNNSSEMSFFIGPEIEELIGYYIFKPLSISIGSYQLAHWGSRIMQYDYGLVLSLSITGSYD